MKLLIRNLARTATEVDLKRMFEAYGAVQYCTLVIDKNTGKSKGFGFVEMPKQGEAKIAMKALNGLEFQGSKIRVKKDEFKQSESKESESKQTELKKVERKEVEPKQAKLKPAKSKQEKPSSNAIYGSRSSK